MTTGNELARVGDERLVFFVLLRSQVSSGEFMLLIQVDKSSRHRCKQVSRPSTWCNSACGLCY